MSKHDNPIAQKRRLALKTLTGSALVGGLADKLPSVWQRPLVHSSALPAHAQVSPLEQVRRRPGLPTVQLQLVDGSGNPLLDSTGNRITLAIPYGITRSTTSRRIETITFNTSSATFAQSPALIEALFPAAYAQQMPTTQMPKALSLVQDLVLDFTTVVPAAGQRPSQIGIMDLQYDGDTCGGLEIIAYLTPDFTELNELAVNAEAMCAGNLQIRAAAENSGFFALPTQRPGQMMNLRLAVFDSQSQQPMSQPLELPVMAETDGSGEITKIMFDGTGVMSSNDTGEPAGLMERLFPAAYAQEFVTDLQLDGQSVNIHGLEIVFSPESHRATGVLNLAWNNGREVCTLVIEATLSEDRTRLYSLAIVERFNCGNGEIRPVNDADQPVADVVISTDLDENPPPVERRIRVAAFILDRIASSPLTLTYQTLFAPDGRIVNLSINKESGVGGDGIWSLEMVTDEIFWSFGDAFNQFDENTRTQVARRVNFTYAGIHHRLFDFSVTLDRFGRNIDQFGITPDDPRDGLELRLLDIGDAAFEVVNAPPPADPDRVFRLLLVGADNEVEGEELVVSYAPVRDAAGRIIIFDFWVDDERQPTSNGDRRYSLNLLNPQGEQRNPIALNPIRHRVSVGTRHLGPLELFYNRGNERRVGRYQLYVDLTPHQVEVTGIQVDHAGTGFANGEQVFYAFHDEGYQGLPAPPIGRTQLDVIVRDRASGFQISEVFSIPLEETTRHADGTISWLIIGATNDPNQGGTPPADNEFAPLQVAQWTSFRFEGRRQAYGSILMRYGYRNFYVSIDATLSVDRMRLRDFRFGSEPGGSVYQVNGDFGGELSNGSDEFYVDFPKASDTGPVATGSSNSTLTIGFAQSVYEADEGGAVVDVNVRVIRNQAQTAPIIVRIKSQNDTNVGLAGYRVLDAQGNAINPPADASTDIGDTELRVEEQYGVLRNFAFRVPARSNLETFTRTIRLQVPRNDVVEAQPPLIELEIVQPASDRIGYTVDDNATSATINIRDRSTTLFAIPIADRTFNWSWEGGEGFAAQGTFTVKSDAPPHGDENAEVVIRESDLSEHVFWMTEGNTLLFVLDMKPGESMGELTTYNYGGGSSGQITPVDAPAGYIKQSVHVAHEFEYTPGRGHFNALSGPIGSALRFRTAPQNLPRGRSISGLFDGVEFERGDLLYGLFGVSQYNPSPNANDSLQPKGGSQSVSEGGALAVPELSQFTYRWHSLTYVVEGAFRTTVLDGRLTNQNNLSMHTLRVLRDGVVFVWANLATREVVARRPDGTYEENTLNLTQAIQYRIGDNRFGNFNLEIPGILSFYNAGGGVWQLNVLGVQEAASPAPYITTGASAITAKPDVPGTASAQTRTVFYYWRGHIDRGGSADRYHVRGELEYTAEDGHVIDSQAADFNQRVTKHIFSASVEEGFIGAGPDDTVEEVSFVRADLTGDTWQVSSRHPYLVEGGGRATGQINTVPAFNRDADDYRIRFITGDTYFNGDFRINLGTSGNNTVFENRNPQAAAYEATWVLSTNILGTSYRADNLAISTSITENPEYAPLDVPTGEFGLVVRFDDEDPGSPSIIQEGGEHRYTVIVQRSGAQTSSIPFKIRVGSGSTTQADDVTITHTPDSGADRVMTGAPGQTLELTAGFLLDADPNDDGETILAGGDEIHYFTVEVNSDSTEELDEILQLEFVTQEFPPSMRTGNPDQLNLTIQAETYHAYRWNHTVNDIRNHRYGQPLVSYRVEGEFRTRSGKTVLQETDIYAHTLRVTRGIYNQPESYTDFVYAINFFGNPEGTEGVLLRANGFESRHATTQDFEYDTTTHQFNLGGRSGIENQGFPVTLSLAHDLAGLTFVRAGEIDVWQLYDGNGRELGRVQFNPPAGALVGDGDDPFQLDLRIGFERGEYEVREGEEVTITIRFTRAVDQDDLQISVAASRPRAGNEDGIDPGTASAEDYILKDLTADAGDLDPDNLFIEQESLGFNLPAQANAVSFVLMSVGDGVVSGDKTVVLALNLTDTPEAVPGENLFTTITIKEQDFYAYRWTQNFPAAGISRANGISYRVDGEFRTRSDKTVLQESDIYYHLLTVTNTNTNQEVYTIDFFGNDAASMQAILRRPDGTESRREDVTLDFEFDTTGNEFNLNNPNTENSGFPVTLSLGIDQYGVVLLRHELDEWFIYDGGRALTSAFTNRNPVINPVGPTPPAAPEPTTPEPTAPEPTTTEALQLIGWEQTSMIITEPTAGDRDNDEFAARDILVNRTGGTDADVVFQITNMGASSVAVDTNFGHRSANDDSDFVIIHSSGSHRLITGGTISGGAVVSTLQTQSQYAFQRQGRGFSLRIYRDNRLEQDEQIVFTLIPQPDYRVDPNKAELTVTIRDNPPANATTPAPLQEIGWNTSGLTPNPNGAGYIITEPAPPGAPNSNEYTDQVISITRSSIGAAADVVFEITDNNTTFAASEQYRHRSRTDDSDYVIIDSGGRSLGATGRVTTLSGGTAFSGLQANNQYVILKAFNAFGLRVYRDNLIEAQTESITLTLIAQPDYNVDPNNNVLTITLIDNPPAAPTTTPAPIPVVVEFAETVYTTARGETTSVIIRRTGSSGSAKVTISSISIALIEHLDADDFTVSGAGATKNGVIGINTVEIPKEQESVTISIAWEPDFAEQAPGKLALQLQSASITAEGGVAATAGNNSRTEITVNPVPGGRVPDINPQ